MLCGYFWGPWVVWSLSGMNIYWGPWVTFVTTNEYLVRVTKLTSRIGVLWTHNLSFCFDIFLTQWIMTILSKGCKRNNFESHNSLKPSFTNIWGLCLNFVECEFFLESNSLDTLALWDANLDDSIDSGNFSVRDYLPSKMILLLMHGPAVYVKEGISWKLYRFLLMFSTGFTSFSTFFIYWSPSLTWFMVFILLHLT